MAGMFIPTSCAAEGIFLRYLELDLVKILNTEPKLEQNLVHWKNFYESLEVSY